MAGSRDQLLAQLHELVQLTVLDEGSPQSFRARAYDNAIVGLRACSDDLETMTEAQLAKLDGVGKSTARKVREFYATGVIGKLAELRQKYPPEYVRLSNIGGLGPKTLARLRDELGVKSVADLKQAIADERLRTLKGLGQKSEEKLARALERLGDEVGEKRLPIAQVMPVARRLVAELESMPEVERIRYCGSLRRLRETIGDVDLLVAARHAAPIMDRFTAMAGVRDVLGHGSTKSSIVTDAGLQVDLRVVEPEQFGAALLYFTGSKTHNIKLRQLAIARGWTLNEYGLTEVDGGRVIAATTEESIYRALGLGWVPPPMREDTGEVERAAADDLPAWVRVEDLRGDLHVHTDLSGDGRSSLDEVVAAARARGLSYLALTDHGEDLAFNGVSRDDLLQQRRAIDVLDGQHDDIRILQGCELNIAADGGLDYDPDFRAGLDWAIASVHSHFDLDRTAQTRRLIQAMQDPAVCAIGHLSGRKIGARPGIELDVDEVLRAAAGTGTAIEINASLARLDASWEVLLRARDVDGVDFIIDTDAHHVDDFARAEWGAQQAQRGWVDRDRVVNTWETERFLGWLSERKGPRRS